MSTTPLEITFFRLLRENTYQLVEDTFLLLDGLEQDAQVLRDQKPLICLEVGSGSGCVSAFIASILGPTNTLYLCTDINDRASSFSYKTGQRNKVPLDPITCDLAQPLKTRLQHSVDVILFNPPYVPTDTEEALHAQSDASISGSWAGGMDGMEITNRFLDDVESLMSENGLFYLIVLEENNISEICRRMVRNFNLQSQVIIERRAGREFLKVLRFSRGNHKVGH